MATRTTIVLGGGVGGLVTAHELRKRLGKEHRVVLVDREEKHIFWPSLLWLQVGLRKPGGIVRDLSRLQETSFPGVFAIGDVTTIPLSVGLPLPKAGVFAHHQAETVAGNIASRIDGTSHSGAFNGHGECFVEVGGGRAGFGRGNFYAEPNPTIKLHKPGRQWHAAKVLFEKNWMRKYF